MSEQNLEYNQNPTPNPQHLNQTPKWSGFGITALILGVVSIPLIFICIGWLTAILAIVFGIIALVTIGGSQGMIKGKGMAITGLALAVFAMVGYLIFGFVVFEKQGGTSGFMEVFEEAVKEAESKAESTSDPATETE